MANVNIKFNNKDYLLSCDDGQEESLKNLTKFLDKKYNELKDKLEFLESIKNKQLQMDLEKVIEVLPEGVLILGDKCKTKLVNN